MKTKYDVAIVGGGPGGLSIGSLLAKEGISSVIIERAPAVGGRYRAVRFHGCRSDNGIRMPTGMVSSPQETFLYKFLSFLKIPVEAKVITWTMGMVSRDNPRRIEFFSMDKSKGVNNFFEMFAFASGMAMEESTKQALTKGFRIMEDMSEEECRKLVSLSFASWIDRNIEDELARVILNVAAPLMGAPADVVNFGAFANVLGTFPRVGALLFWYPKHGNMEDLVIAPLTEYYTEHGGDILTNRRARTILIENGRAKGVVVQNNRTGFLEEYSASAAVCAMPIFEAVRTNVLRKEFLTDDWAESIRLCANLAFEDLSTFYLLREEIVPRKGPGWIHLYDADYGIPTYVGDLCVGSFFNATEPPGKQLIYGYIPGGLDATPFGLISDMSQVNEGNRRFKETVNKAFPGFIEAIQHEGMTLALNWGRYAWAAVPTEIDIQSPNIKGLFFAGDTIRSVTSMVSDKIYQMAFPLQDVILKYLKSRDRK